MNRAGARVSLCGGLFARARQATVVAVTFFGVTFGAGLGDSVAIQGRVVDGEDQPVIGASVSLTRAHLATTTDQQGRFKILGNVGVVRPNTVRRKGVDGLSRLELITDGQVSRLPAAESFSISGRRATVPTKRSTGVDGSRYAAGFYLLQSHKGGRQTEGTTETAISRAVSLVSDTVRITKAGYDTLRIPSGNVQDIGTVVLPLEPISYKIAKWHRFYRGCISLCFDNVQQEDSATLASIITILGDRERRIGATFFIDPLSTTIKPSTWSNLKNAVLLGYDVGCRPGLGSGVNQTTVVGAALQAMAQKLPGYHPASWAYQAETVLPDVATKFLSARIGDRDTMYSEYPTDLFRMQTNVIATGTQAALEQKMQAAIDSSSWILVRYGNRGSDFQEAMDNVLNFHTQLWDASVSAVTKYIMESRTSRLSLLSKNDTLLTFSLTSPLNDTAYYDQPLTLQFLLPDGWTNFSPTQDGNRIWGGMVTGRARIDAIPNRGKIVLKKRVD